MNRGDNVVVINSGIRGKVVTMDGICVRIKPETNTPITDYYIYDLKLCEESDNAAN